MKDITSHHTSHHTTFFTYSPRLVVADPAHGSLARVGHNRAGWPTQAAKVGAVHAGRQDKSRDLCDGGSFGVEFETAEVQRAGLESTHSFFPLLFPLSSFLPLQGLVASALVSPIYITMTNPLSRLEVIMQTSAIDGKAISFPDACREVVVSWGKGEARVGVEEGGEVENANRKTHSLLSRPRAKPRPTRASSDFVACSAARASGSPRRECAGGARRGCGPGRAQAEAEAETRKCHNRDWENSQH